MYPETLDLFLRHAAAAMVLLRSATGAGYLQVFDLLMKQSSALAGSLRPVQFPAVALIAATLLLPFTQIGHALKSFGHPSGGSARPALVAAGAPLAPACGTASVPDSGADPAAEAAATPDPPFEVASGAGETLAPRVSSLRLARRSIERGPPFFL